MGSPESQKLTNRMIDALPPGPPRGRWYCDKEQKCFFAVRYPESTVFFVRAVLLNGTRRTVKIGEYGPWTPTAARKRAQALLAQMAGGYDPRAEKDRLRALPTWQKWSEDYLKRAEKRLRPNTIKDSARYLARTYPKWGARRLSEITPTDILSMRDEWEKHPAAADHFRAIVGAVLEEAVEMGYLAANPTRRVRPYGGSVPRQRVPTVEEMKKILASLDEEYPEVRVAFRMLIYIGARPSEVTRLRWEDVDLERGLATVRLAKSNKPRGLPLTDALIEELKALPRRSPWCFPSPHNSENTRNKWTYPWKRILTRAGLASSGLHIYDLRRGAGDDVVMQTGSTRQAADLLGHKDERITRAHYSPTMATVLRPIVEERARLLNERVGRE